MPFVPIAPRLGAVLQPSVGNPEAFLAPVTGNSVTPFVPIAPRSAMVPLPPVGNTKPFPALVKNKVGIYPRKRLKGIVFKHVLLLSIGEQRSQCSSKTLQVHPLQEGFYVC